MNLSRLMQLILLGSLLAIINHAECQECSANDAEFYLGLIPNLEAQSSVLLLTNEPEVVNYTIDAPVTGYHFEGSFNGSVFLNLPVNLTGISRSYPNAYQNDYKEGIYIKTSSEKVTLIGQMNSDNNIFNTGTFLSLFKVDLSLEEYVYYAVSIMGDFLSADTSVVLVGTGDETMFTLTVPVNASIKINNTANWTSLTEGIVYSYQINRLDIVYITASEAGTDMTGTKVVANKAMSVFSGHECGSIPTVVAFCDFLVEQMLPTELWGEVYYFAPLIGQDRYTIKIIAAENDTDCQLYCSTTQRNYSLDAGDYSIATLTNLDFCVIHSTKKILVVQFSNYYLEDYEGGPMMTLVPPASHYTNIITSSTIQLFFDLYDHHINIIVFPEYHQPEAIFLTAGGMNSSLVSYNWIPIVRNNITEAYATQINVTQGLIQLRHSNNRALMNAIVYGFDFVRGYGHPGWLKSCTVLPFWIFSK
ncbi:uncharacterized protein [Dysidea avara]|uniref:uncharacterized protein isoform X2 n=1 Tax=Dysidea avara TaxID=196820 RepID=UPI003319F6A2